MMPAKPAFTHVRFSRRAFLKLLAKLGVGIGAGSLYALWLEPSWIETTHIRLKLRRLPAAFSGFRLAQMADLHFGSWMTLERLQPALELVVAQNPDVVVITGDFVHGSPGPAGRALGLARDAFRSLAQRFPTFAVMGNHDHWVDVEMVRAFLGETGIRELRNDVFPFEKDGQRFYLCGVDDIWEKKYDLKPVLEKLATEDCAVLLAHEPDFADQAAATGQFDLQVSGHSHGGQVVIPFIGPPLLPWLGQKYPAGLYRVGKMFQYTNRGLGMAKLTVRFNCRPEITIFTLEST
jgi:predicted MPP superfamily phosphohydrolase